MEKIFTPGGLTLYLETFLAQFFIIPYLGALITALLLATASVLTAFICKRIEQATPLYALWFLPAAALLFMHYNINYHPQGTIAFIFALVAIYFYIGVRRFNYRLLAGFIAVLLLYWWAGAIANLFAVCILLWEAINRTKHGYWIILIVVEAVCISLGSVYFSVLGEYKFAFLPDFYFRKELKPEWGIYYSWIILPIILLGAFLFRKRKPINTKREIIESLVHIALIAGIFYGDTKKMDDPKLRNQAQMNYYSRTSQWDKMITLNKERTTDPVQLAYINRALAEKSVLADRMFTYSQHGMSGLLVPKYLSCLSSEIYFTLGYIAFSQELAFETYIISMQMGDGSPYMLQRLVQTNLIYGEWPVAEKYLDRLEQTIFYKDWAKQHRKFLYNDAEVENDALLGMKRKCISGNHLRNTFEIEQDLRILVSKNPENHAAVEYLGAAYLLTKNKDAFLRFVRTLLGTPALPNLPVSYQEALLLFETDAQTLEKYRIPLDVVQRFESFKAQSSSKVNNPQVMIRSFGDTYWFYYTFYKEKQQP
ncbi:hypothetical protein FACS1894160_3930 [Bacteroidia bacterium]|nr:hypothetical protein FACS1894160_3930 [Bacteroidia bacterium]